MRVDPRVHKIMIMIVSKGIFAPPSQNLSASVAAMRGLYLIVLSIPVPSYYLSPTSSVQSSLSGPSLYVPSTATQLAPATTYQHIVSSGSAWSNPPYFSTGPLPVSSSSYNPSGLLSATAPMFVPSDALQSQTKTDHQVFGVGTSATSGPGPGQPTSNNQWVGADAYGGMHRIKPLELPKFNGKKDQYIQWRERFRRLVDYDPTTSEYYKMTRLRECLAEGSAEELISNILDGPGAYVEALKEIEAWYGGNEQELERQEKEIMAWKQITSERDTEALKHLALKLRKTLMNMRVCGETPGRELYRVVTQKVPATMLIRYFEAHDDQTSNLETFANWLLTRVHTLRRVDERLAPAVSTSRASTGKPNRPDRYPNQARTLVGVTANKSASVSTAACKKCKGPHQLAECSKFKEMTVRARWELVKPMDICICCLRPGTHRSANCKASPCTACGRRHHLLLHITKPEAPVSASTQDGSEPSAGSSTKPAPKSNSSTSVEHTHQTLEQSDSRPVSFMLLPVRFEHKNRSVLGTALLDPASSASYVSEDTATLLRLHGDIENLETSVLGGKTIRGQRQKVTLTVTSAQNDSDCKSTTISAWVLPEVAKGLPTVNWNEQKEHWPHLKDLSFPVLQGPVVALIGLNAVDFHVTLEERLGQSGQPVARRTPFGWVCFGPTIDSASTSQSAFHTVTDLTNLPEGEMRLEDLVQNFWDVERIGVTDEYLTPADRCAEELTDKTLSHNGERFTVGIPWVSSDGEPHLPSNRPLADQRLRSLERTLSRKPEVLASYQGVINDYLSKGYIEPVGSSEAGDLSSEQWFLPHFPVIRSDKTTTKVRIVFDGSAQWDGRSLNGEMYAGRKTQNNIVHILLRFCLEPVALCGDVSEMFLQVGLMESDRKYFRFLWRTNPETNPEVFQFTRVVFGAKASPYLAARALEQTAEKFSHSSDIKSIIQDSFYVDDMLQSFPDVNKAIEAREEIKAVLQAGGFRIRKWMTNSEEVMESIPPSDRASTKTLELGESDQNPTLPSAKVLGVTWRADEDVFTFAYPEPVSITSFTKRSVLRKMATIFDPRGQIAPFTVRSKVLFQETCILGLGWDDEMRTDLAKRWQRWFSELSALSNIRSPRCFALASQPMPAKVQVHTFVDASDVAYAAASYIRYTYPDGKTKTTLALAKARPAPIRKLTIPKLELKAAVQGVKLSQEIDKAIKVPISEHIFWSDSMNVLYWVRSPSRRFKTDIGTKVAEIHALTSGSQWRHVPGRINPADKPTRGMSAADLADCKEWWCGPEFLNQHEDNWPRRDIVVPTQLLGETKRSLALTFTAYPTLEASFRLNPDHFSSWIRLVRVTGWCRRFIKNIQACLGKTESSSSPTNYGGSMSTVNGTEVPELSISEIEEVEAYWISLAQQDVYGEALKLLKKGKPLPNNHPLRKLNPGLSDRQLLTVQGRLDASGLPESLRRPVILPQQHRVTELIIAAEDVRCHHEFGVNYLWANLAEKYWIVHAKSAIKNVRRNCNACRRRWNQPATQLMGQLPAPRIDGSQVAFNNVGVDYAGPFETRQGRGKTRAKRYLCVFSCLETRACHLELANDMSADGFLQCFSRFQKRRGTPSSVVSDNGTNFVAADRELREAVQKLRDGKIAASMATQTIEWRFNPPHAPHHGGVFESIVKTAKRAIHAVLKNASCTDQELSTAIVEAEHLLNSRPLSALSTDSNDLTPLTPYHFLIGRSVIATPLEVCADDEDRVHPVKRWRVVQRLVRDIWRRWLRELVPMLNVRQKWWKAGRDLKIGEVVMYMEPHAPRGAWPLGRVTNVHPGPDGRVRVVDIAVKGREYRRPINVLVPLENEPVSEL